MLIKHKKQFAIGFIMMLVFFGVLALMFMPLFNGQNSLEASDGLFNSISKASTDHFDAVSASVDALEEKDAAQKLAIPEPLGNNLVTMITATGSTASYADGELTVSGSLNEILRKMVADSKVMFANDGEVIEKAYSIEPREAMYSWWTYANAASKAFKLDKRFDSAKMLDDVKAKAVEVGYNYFGVEPTPVTERIGIVTFALVFYVLYTMWWGFSIFYLFEGLGLLMKKGAKQEG